jgi:hypothetical protein
MMFYCNWLYCYMFRHAITAISRRCSQEDVLNKCLFYIILKCIFMKWDGGVDWIDHGQDRDKW